MGVGGGLAAALVAATSATNGHPSWGDVGTFAVAASMVLAGAIGVVLARNAVHSALMLVLTLFGVAVLFVLQQEPFLAVVQVIVYAGAIVVLFLFVIMFLGVDREENITQEPLRGQRPLAIGLVLLGTTSLLLLGQVSGWTTGHPQVAGPSTASGQTNVSLLGKSIYTTYLFPFEATAALLIIAVVGAVVLARRPPATPRADRDRAEAPDGSADPAAPASSASSASSAGSVASGAPSGSDAPRSGPDGAAGSDTPTVPSGPAVDPPVTREAAP
jgi:NADH-quinone oxidoreductase subunit J